MGDGRWSTDSVGFCVMLGKILALSECRVFSSPMKVSRSKAGYAVGTQTGAVHTGGGFVAMFKVGDELERNVPNVV